MPQERDDIIRSAMAYKAERARRSEHQRASEEPPPHPGFNGGDKAEPLPCFSLALWAGKRPPPLRFIDSARMLPAQTVVLLGGDGGAGKSTLALQLMLACTTGNRWLGLDVDPGPVLYFSAEDPEPVLHNRVAEICEAEAIDLAEAHQAMMISWAGKETVLAYEKNNQLVVTSLWWALAARIAVEEPELVFIDNLADVFAGNENNRSLAKQFVGLLSGLAIRHDCTIVLLAHPSLTGLTSGTGTSGSTAWSNSVRARLYLHKAEGPDAEDDSKRILEVMKANYGPSGTRLHLQRIAGRFVRQDPRNPWDRVAISDLERVKEMFSSGLWRCSDQAQDWGGYAVAEVLDLDIGARGSTKKHRNPEQNRLRDDVMTYLALWERNGAIFRIRGLSAKREPTFFYSNRQEERDATDAG